MVCCRARRPWLVKAAEKEVVRRREPVSGTEPSPTAERYNKIIEIWSKVTERVSDEMMSAMEEDDRTGPLPSTRFTSWPIRAARRFQAADPPSSRGCGGLMAKPSGEIIETPITANFPRRGLNVLQYFISTHGAR